MKRRKRVIACGKRRYRTPDEAKHALLRIRESGWDTGQGKPYRWYECPWCKGIHLSSEAA